MIDGLWSGLLGGFLGSIVAKILGKFSCWKVFVFLLTCIYIFIFSVAIFKAGFKHGFATAVEIASTIPGALVPIGFAAIFAFCALLQARSDKKG